MKFLKIGVIKKMSPAIFLYSEIKINNIKVQMIPFIKIFYESHNLAGFEDLAMNKKKYYNNILGV